MVELEILGLMSGTSLDGLDIAHVKFSISDQKKEFKLLNSKTFTYSNEFKKELRQATNLTVEELLILDKKIGKEFATVVNLFLEEKKIERNKIDAIASHGQTVFHQPENGFTLQIGCGASIAFHTHLHVINDFRTMDVVAGGQGAPLVPKGDFDLFDEKADAFLNLGGFANISLKESDEIIAFDICPTNLPLNQLVNELGFDFDENGNFARNGKVQVALLDELNKLEYYFKSAPKSLGTEWLEKEFYTIIEKHQLNTEDKLATIIDHIAIQIANTVNEYEKIKIFATGGGTKNLYLMERIRYYTNSQIIVPDEEISDFKEAIVFAYLGALFILNQPNCVSSVTGSRKNVIGGSLHKAF
jgi:anhydro-N-acetylmuramic acid kinase